MPPRSPCTLPKRSVVGPKYPVRAFTLQSVGTMRSLPPEAVPVDVFMEPTQHVIPTFVSSILASDPATQAPCTWADYLSSLPRWEQELVADSTIVERRLLFQAMRTSDCVFLASNGGAVDRRGSFTALLAPVYHIIIMSVTILLLCESSESVIK
jgi:hypothetical protein